MMKTKAQVAYEQIKREIMRGNYPTNAPLSESFFSAKLSMSRTPIRLRYRLLKKMASFVYSLRRALLSRNVI